MSERPLNILLVEDDEVDVLNIRRAFAKKGIQSSLYVACDGVEALKMLRGKPGSPPEVPLDRRLVLLDINMPRMGGIELLQEMRSIPGLKATPVVVLTTSDEERDRVAAHNLNVAGYLLKPLDPDRLADMIAKLHEYWTLNELP